jgi:starch phosphorylase
VKRMRTSMSRLAPGFSSIRMMEEYFRDYYGPAARAFEFRRSDGGRRASELEDWYQRTHRNWPRVHFGEVETHLEESHWRFRAQVYLCDLSPEEVSVQVFAAGSGRHDSVCEPMEVVGTIPGSVGGYIFQGRVAAARPENDYSARVIPFHPDARVPIENSLILWQR